MNTDGDSHKATRTQSRTKKKLLSILSLLVFCANAGLAQQQHKGALRGQLMDEHGGVITATKVTLINAEGSEVSTTTDDRGVFSFEDLPAAKYAVKVTATGFAPFEKADVFVGTGARTTLEIKLTATIGKQQVTMSTNNEGLSTDPHTNKTGLVLKGRDLEALPDDPDDLATTLQVLAGASAGPNGGQVFVDGFAAAGRGTPQKSAIREIQINQNPFAAEHDKIGFGRIEIFTKPGSGQLHGAALAMFNDESFNARNPFAARRAPFQARAYGGNLTGALRKDKASFFLTGYRREIDDNAVINATLLDSNFNIKPFSQSLLTPKRFIDAGGRFDYTLNQKNTLTARYNYSSSHLNDVGVGQFSLVSRGYDVSGSDQTLQLTETAVLSAKVVNETRFQYIQSRIEQADRNSQPAIVVLDSFMGGGPQVGLSFNNTSRWEAQNYTTAVLKNHTVKAGLRLRGVNITDVSRSNFGGAYTFAGGRAPALDQDSRLVLDASGKSVLVDVSSLERYRRTLLLQSRGLDWAAIRAMGGGATLLTIAGGIPTASVSQIDLGAFAQDDWRIAPNFTLSLGLRYEAQTNIGDNTNFSPRVAFAWSPNRSAASQTKTVIRGGFGVFFERFGEGLTLQANRFDGVNQKQYIITDPQILGSFPNVPSIEALDSFLIAGTVRRTADGIRSPYTVQSSISVERQLPFNFTAAAAYINSTGSNYLRTRNTNAPIPGSDGSSQPGSRPLPGLGDVFEYESDGKFRQHLLTITAYNRLNKHYTLFGSYVLGKAEGDTDGVGTFPANGFDLKAEYGRSVYDIRHRVFLGGLINLPAEMSLNPLVIISSGAPFNITTGIDSNRDTLFTERPAFAGGQTSSAVKVTRLGAFVLNPSPGERIIPRNFGSGPFGFTVNMRLAKTFTFRGITGGAAKPAPQKPSRGQTSTKATSDRSYKLTVSVFAFNLLNRTNRGTPIGNLSSPFFGLSNTLASSALGLPGSSNAASNRRIDIGLQLRF
jgi:carboxypeptidase family protein/TonB-dependent receptor-like protein